MIDDATFRRAICVEPENMGLREVYHDWKEEQGDPWAEFYRVQMELARIGIHAGAIPVWNAPWCTCPSCELRRREAELLTAHRREWTMQGLVEACWGYSLNEWVFWAKIPIEQYPHFIEPTFRCGFPELVRCRWEEWAAHHRTLRDAWPVREVELTTMPEWAIRHTGNDFEHTMSLEFPGIAFTLPAPQAATCPRCGGSGVGRFVTTMSSYDQEPCPACHGSGLSLPPATPPVPRHRPRTYRPRGPAPANPRE